MADSKCIQTQTDSHILDPYEGIFYSSQQNDANTAIQFKSSVLCDLVRNKISADFNHPADVTLFNISTRVQNVKCLLSFDLETEGLEISGLGHKLWTENKFRRKMPEFLQQMVVVTNSNQQSSSSRHHLPDQQTQEFMNGPPDVSATDKQTSPENTENNLLLHTICEELHNLKSETKVLREEIKIIKEQRPTYAAILSRDSHSTDSSQQQSGNKSLEVTASSPDNSITDSTTSPTVSQQAINVVISDRTSPINDRSPPNDQLNTPRRTPAERQVQTDNSTSQKNVLILGDSILHGINPKGLKNNVHKHSVSGGQIKTIISDIEMFDLSQFHTVILYIGGNDISRNRDLELIEEEYDQLVAIIKAGNENCKVVLCKVAPRGDVDVNQINLIIERLSLHHQAECVDTYRSFHDRHGKIIARFLNESDHLHLSKSGTKRILAEIDTSIKIVHDFSKCVFFGKSNQFVHQHRHSRSPRHPFGTRHYRPQSIRCMNCNESSHLTEECRHRAPIKCWLCGLSGHKQDSCWY